MNIYTHKYILPLNHRFDRFHHRLPRTPQLVPDTMPEAATLLLLRVNISGEYSSPANLYLLRVLDREAKVDGSGSSSTATRRCFLHHRSFVS